MADSRLATVASHILSVLTDDLIDAGIDVPSRRYVTAGEVSHDFEGENCADAFVVSWALNFPGIPGADASNQAMVCAVPLAAGFTVNLLRCVPNLNSLGRAPTPNELNASANQILTDAMTLAVAIIDAHLAQDLTDIGCSLASMGNIAAFGPQGGVGGTVIELVVGLI